MLGYRHGQISNVSIVYISRLRIYFRPKRIHVVKELSGGSRGGSLSSAPSHQIVIILRDEFLIPEYFRQLPVEIPLVPPPCIFIGHFDPVSLRIVAEGPLPR